MKTDRIVTAILGVSLATLATVTAAGSAYGQNKIKVIKPKPEAPAQPVPAPAATESSEPDKVLYERAMADMKRRRYIEERLSLQTLVNTYPDSEYLAKAKLSIADSFYLEGGTANYTEAIAEYKSFIVFFPFLDEAAYAQMQVAMAHYRMMEKSDRDNSEGESSEVEFQTFLLKFPDSKLAPQAEQKLREVQEVLADGAFRVARFYYLRPDYRASAARLVDLTQRYPLYSQSDEALWMLGSIYDVAKKNSKNEDDQNHWADLATKCYDQIVVSYPLSDRAPLAKQRLKEMGMAVPAADPMAAARMKQQVEYQRTHRPNMLTKMPMSMIKSSPDLTAAARAGTPNLSAPETAVSATDILTPGAAGPSFNLAATSGGGGGVSNDGPAVGPGAVVPGTGNAAGSLSDADAGGHTTVGTPTTTSVPADSSNELHDATVNAPTTSSTPSSTSSSASTDAAPADDTTSQPDTPAAAGSAQTGQSTADPSAGTQAQQTAPPASKNESSSKKKKGLSKINPF